MGGEVVAVSLLGQVSYIAQIATSIAIPIIAGIALYWTIWGEKRRAQKTTPLLDIEAVPEVHVPYMGDESIESMRMAEYYYLVKVINRQPFSEARRVRARLLKFLLEREPGEYEDMSSLVPTRFKWPSRSEDFDYRFGEEFSDFATYDFFTLGYLSIKPPQPHMYIMVEPSNVAFFIYISQKAKIELEITAENAAPVLCEIKVTWREVPESEGSAWPHRPVIEKTYSHRPSSPTPSWWGKLLVRLSPRQWRRKEQ